MLIFFTEVLHIIFPTLLSHIVGRVLCPTHFSYVLHFFLAEHSNTLVNLSSRYYLDSKNMYFIKKHLYTFNQNITLKINYFITLKIFYITKGEIIADKIVPAGGGGGV